MITVNLILTIVGLLFLLIALVAIYVWSSKSKTSYSISTEIETFDSLSAVIRNKSSSNAALSHAVEAILHRFGTIGSPTLESYKNLIETLCVHPHTDSKLLLRFEKGLRQANPAYSHEIEQALAIGLAARG
ncbi:hypothetical protein [uncultured Sulfuricurvum sp.]|uniref:hypothetical protein n=1 Tax=Sulfuricurvum sp. TaxID=2025608 RepID=UPI002627160F|nr:hypothetical protein [uncultured Sulfuricurvum sp.]